ncbi:hypothetical protein XELAEV_18022562mg [Xenopus laevis]|uniref:Uncharacterized protein n=1 Tax=Xenopus laevis TaxID=8355 RepID=A0A974HNA0_XENLA|nr:hypothetical protein XELAEV_18022562mg [Xenopus laevis]
MRMRQTFWMKFQEKKELLEIQRRNEDMKEVNEFRISFLQQFEFAFTVILKAQVPRNQLELDHEKLKVILKAQVPRYQLELDHEKLKVESHSSSIRVSTVTGSHLHCPSVSPTTGL